MAEQSPPPHTDDPKKRRGRFGLGRSTFPMTGDLRPKGDGVFARSKAMTTPSSVLDSHGDIGGVSSGVTDGIVSPADTTLI